MYAQGKGYVTCSEPKICVQPGTEIVEYEDAKGNKVELEFCAQHAVRRWVEQGYG